MSDFVARDISKLWDEILQRHWTYLETEDGLQKLDERKKLEGCLKEFLCIVPHDRKFFLPETTHVLKKSIKDNPEFSAYKAMIGFESISQYANNLFTKPWRKEYRVIKMYSGFYQHEIKSNLIDAEKLFEAMGYRQLHNELLVLDGPICPDQVTNVSRDAMAAYVECQIMKQILNGLSQIQLTLSWSDLFNFRESHICGVSQGVKSIAYTIQERRFRKDKILQENCYAQPTQTHFTQQSNCPACCNSSHSCHQQLPSALPCQIHGNSNGHLHNKPLSSHHLLLQQHCTPSPQQHFGHYHSQHPQIPHSKSLEHYNENLNQQHLMPSQRHSFDHPSSYDTYNGHQNCQFSMYNQHPYNVSGNRYPLPYPLSTQLNNPYGPQSVYGPQNNGHYAVPVNCTGHKINPLDSQVHQHPQQSTSNCALHPTRNGSRTSQQFSQNDHLIDFNEQPLPIVKEFSTDLNALTLNERQISLNRVTTGVGTDDLDGIYSFPPKSDLKKSAGDHSRKFYDNNLSNTSSTDSTITTKSSQQPHKNHDGVGSYESWDFVFQNLEKHGYTKDLGDRGDLLVQGLNLDSGGGTIIPSSSTEKRKNKLINPDEKIEKVNHVTKSANKISEARIVNNRHSSAGGKMVEKSPNTPSIAKITKTSKTSSSLKNSAVNNNVGEYGSSSVDRKKLTRSLENGNSKNSINGHPSAVQSSKAINEWSCRFCTFLNPDTKRICEMCCRSKDFNLDVKNTSSPTCV